MAASQLTEIGDLMATSATTTIKIAKGDEGIEMKDPKPTKGGKVKYEVRGPGFLVLAYVEADQAREHLSALGLRLTGKKATVKAQPKKAAKTTADDLV